MKRFAITSTLAGMLLVLGTGCLKDKGFENGQYGLNVSDIKAVAFPNANKSPQGFGLNSQATTQVVNGLLAITLETSGVADADITVNLSNTTGTTTAGDIKSYNDASGENVQIFPSSLYTLPASVTIAAGQKFVEFPITFSNTTSLNPNLKYGVGITIASASNGYQVAANMKNMILVFSVKNKYDARYNLTGYHNRVPYTFPYQTEMHLVTTGPSNVIFWWPEVGGVGHPIGIGPGNSMSWYGSTVAPQINFDPATDLVASVIGTDPAGPPITMFTGAGSRLSKYDPATKHITVDWNYNGNPLRAFFDDMDYLGPR
ncbi:MAG: DUF1735 domain-containing protein [Chitinophagaceae bacterium]|nr:DUF1735 domain-containing protein [Chitinophagaceae bacterium]